jgi:hypothetical protein
LNEAEEIEILNRCNLEIKKMKRDAEDADLWMGYKDDFNLKKTRRFVDRLSAITALCVKASNRVLDFGKEEENMPHEKNKNSK